MRALLAVLALVLLATTASAGPTGPDNPIGYRVAVDPLDASCPTCVGAEASVYTVEPDNCADCGGVGATVGAENDADGTTVGATVCRGGFVYICPVDEEITV